MATLEIKDFIKEVGENTVAHGFRDETLKPTDFVALIHSEISEILEEFRQDMEQRKYIIVKMESLREFHQN